MSEAVWTFCTCLLPPSVFGLATAASAFLGMVSLRYAKTDRDYSTLATALFVGSGLCLGFFPSRSAVHSCRQAVQVNAKTVLAESKNAEEREDPEYDPIDNGVASLFVILGIVGARSLRRFDPEYVGMFCCIWAFHSFRLLRTLHAALAT